jgi:hypothetical protein
MLELYRTLIRLRRELPEFSDTRLDHLDVELDVDVKLDVDVGVDVDAEATEAKGLLVVHRGQLAIVANLGTSWREVALTNPQLLLATDGGTMVVGDGVRVAPASAAVVRQGLP